MSNPYIPEEQAENPYLAQVEPATQAQSFLDNHLKQAASITESVFGGEDAAQVILKNKDLPVGQTIVEASEATRAYFMEGIEQLRTDALAPGIPLDMGSLQDLNQIAAELTEATSDPAEFPRYTAEALTAESEQGFGELELEEWQQYKSAQFLDENGFGDWVTDIGSFMVPIYGDGSRRDLEALGKDFSVPAWLGSDDALQQKRAQLQTMDPRARAAELDLWRQAAFEATGNRVIANDFARRLGLSTFEAEKEGGQTLDKLMTGLDVFGLVGAAAKVSANLMRAASTAHKFKRAGRDTDASRAIIASATDSEAAARLGMAQDTAQQSMQPFDLTAVGLDTVPGMADKIAEFETLVKAATQTGAEARLVAAEADVQSVLNGIQRAPGVETVEFIGLQGNRLTTKIRQTGETTAQERVFDLADFGDYGTYQTRELGYYKANITSPVTKFLPDIEDLATIPNLANMQVARAKKAYEKPLREFSKGLRALKKPERAELERVIRVGDNQGKVFTPSELRTEWREVSGTRQDKMIESYYQHRLMMDHAWEVRAADMVASARRDGFRQVIDLNIDGGAGSLVRKFEDFNGAWTAMKAPQEDVAMVYSPGFGFIRDLSPERIKDLYAKGQVIVKSRTARKVGEDSYATYFAVRADELRDIRKTDVLGQREGYAPKLHEDALYFVTQQVRGTVNGRNNRLVQNRVTEAFSSKKKAEAALVAQHGSLEAAEGAGFRIRFDREFEATEREALMSRYSGLFSGARKEGGLKVDGVEDSDMADIQRSTQRYFDNLAEKGILENMRKTLRQKWLNTYASSTPPELQGNFMEALPAVVRRLPPSEARAAREMHAQIRSVSSIKTADEILTEKGIRELGEKMTTSFGRLGELPGQALVKASRTDPTGIAKNLTFHLTLGLLSPAQLIVQGSGMIVSMAAHPKAFTKLLPAMLRDAVRDADKAYDITQASRVHQLWRSSGMYDSVDFQADISTGLAKGDAVKFTEVFFRHGELMNRRASFYTAYDVVKARKGRELTNTDMVDIVREANKFNLDFSTTNKAKWQNGILGVITQFSQVMEKSFNQIYNPLVKSPMTRAERARIAATQALAFGAVGIPFAPWIMQQLDGQIGKMDLSSDEAEFLKRGLVGLATGDWNLSGRIAIGQMVATFPFKIIMGGIRVDNFQESLERGLLGPFGTTLARSFTVFDSTAKALATSIEAPEAAAAAWKTVANDVLAMPKTTRDAIIAYMMWKDRKLVSSTGNVMIDDQDFTPMEITWRALGMQPDAIDDLFELKERKEWHNQSINAMGDYVADLYRNGMNQGDRSFEEEWTTLMNVLAGFDEPDRAKILERLDSQLADQKDLLERVYEDFITNPAYGGMQTANPTVKRQLEELESGE